MNILTFNCGSSSQAFKVYNSELNGEARLLAAGKAKNVATKTRAESLIDWKIGDKSESRITDLSSHQLAAESILRILEEAGIGVDAVGHRFVHGGPYFQHTVKVDEAVMQRLKECVPFAPIHTPNSYSVIEVCNEHLPGVPQYAVFDTAFHAGMPQVSRQYAIPRDLAEKYGLYKYGFHGLSYQFVSARLAELMGRPLASLKLIMCHLGTGGSSVVAFKDGRSLDTSMGYSPLQGLVMSTRCGDMDAEVALEMVRRGFSADEVSKILNNQSGLIGLSGFSSNLNEIIEAGEQGNAACQLAYDIYAQRLGHYLGAYQWLLNGADAIVFTDDVGLKSWQLREKVCSGVDALGVKIDADANRRAAVNLASRVSTPDSPTQIWVVPTDEELVILHEVLTLI